ALDTDACAVVITHCDVRAFDAIDYYAYSPDHERGLSFDRTTFEMRSRLAAQDQSILREHGALFIGPGCQPDLGAGLGRRSRGRQIGELTTRSGWLRADAELRPVGLLHDHRTFRCTLQVSGHEPCARR